MMQVTDKAKEAMLNLDRKLRFRPGVAVFVPDAQRRFPMGRRKTGNHDDGTWCLPGGGLEWGENFCEAATRETLEECGLQIEYMGQICSHTYYNEAPDSYHLTVYTLGGLMPGATLVNGEPNKFYEWKWFTVDTLPVLDLAFPCTVVAATRFAEVLDNPKLLIEPRWGDE